MSFKDIDYKKLNRDRELRLELNNKIAVINKLNDRTLSPAMRIATAELVSGKTLQPKSDPMKELFQEQEMVRSLAPVVKEIDALKDEIHAQTTVLEDQQLALDPPPTQLLALEGIPAGTNLYKWYRFTDDEIAYYKNNDYPNLNKLWNDGDQEYIKSFVDWVTTQIRGLRYSKASIEKMRSISRGEKDIHKAPLEREQQYIIKYKEVLERMYPDRRLRGTGLPQSVTIGSYQIPLRRLKRENIASVRYANNPKKIVPGFGVRRVSNDVKNALLGKAVGSLSAGEKAWLDKLFTRAAPMYTSMPEIVERVKVVLGEIEAGNTSIDLRNELNQALHYHYKHKKITKADYTSLIKISI